jgi:L-malate glycosyltransferase
MTYKQAILKQRIEFVLIYPIVLLGKIFGNLYYPYPKNAHFLFYPSADIGGSIKVNAQITNCISNKRPLIIFSKKPKNNQFKKLFEIEGVNILNLGNKIDNKYFHFINIFYRGVIASWINKASNPVVFGGEALYFYKIIPHVKKSTKIIELCHLNTWFNYSQAFVQNIDARIFSTKQVQRDVEKMYEISKLPQQYFNRLHFIDNSIEIPAYNKIDNKLLQVLFVGRGAAQKRIHLLVAIVKKAATLQLPVHFTFVGDVEEYFEKEQRVNYTLLGNLNERSELEKIYDESDVLILTSLYEGLPLVVMDMMARGKVILSTAVGGIPDYITHLQNGLLINETDENKIVDTAIDLLKLLISDTALKNKLGYEAYQSAKNNFSEESFNSFYKEILS